ncbi:MAG TPA: cytochrome oxidase small assembly protein [Burkholderiales bacterium]|nr:cytochrome oxidase small assembly protein [Burkholderiales bacterium]
MMQGRVRRASNRRTALVLASIAAAFFLGIMLKYILLK